MNTQPVIVTAFFDIGRSEWSGEKNGHTLPSYLVRDTETYMKRFDRLAAINNQIIVYSEPKFENHLNQYPNVTYIDGTNFLYLARDSYREQISQIQRDSGFIEFVDSPAMPEYWNPDYVLVNYLKSFFASNVYSRVKDIDPKQAVAWIDFGYARDMVYVPENKYWTYDYDGKINLWTNHIKFELVRSYPVFKLIKTGFPLIRGCHIVSDYSGWIRLRDEVETAMKTLLSIGMIDDDQTMLLIASRNLNNRVSYKHGNRGNWFEIFENYNVAL